MSICQLEFRSFERRRRYLLGPNYKHLTPNGVKPVLPVTGLITLHSSQPAIISQESSLLQRYFGVRLLFLLWSSSTVGILRWTNRKEPHSKISLTKHLNYRINDNHTHKATREGERPLNRLTLASQQSTHHYHPTLPSIMLIKWKQVPGRDQQVDPSEDRSIGGDTDNQVEDHSTQMHEQLLSDRTFFQRSAIKPNK